MERLRDLQLPSDEPTSSDLDRLKVQARTWEPEVSYAPIPERLVGVSLLSIYLFLSAAVLAFLFVTSWFRAVNSYDGNVGNALEDLGGSVYVLPISIIADAVAGFGLLLLRSWGLVVAVIVFGLAGTIALVSNFSTPLTGSTLMQILIPVLAVIYLLQPGVLRAFED